MQQRNTLIVVTGPTATGKTGAAIAMAQRLHCHIINADSRQIYRGIPIVTAAPTPEQLALVPHHFVAFKDLDEYYSAWQFEQDVMALLPSLWQQGNCVVMCGGSMLYVDAVCRGIDPMPSISDEVRTAVAQKFETQGLAALVDELRTLDPVYCQSLDLNNTRRVMHAVEVCRQAGVPYSTLMSGVSRERPFSIVKVALELDRETLFARINARVDAMVAAGLEHEACSVYHLRHLNALNTVGLKEMFAYFDGTMPRDIAIERIKKNTRVYAKKQLTWLRRDTTIHWLRSWDELLDYSSSLLGTQV